MSIVAQRIRDRLRAYYRAHYDQFSRALRYVDYELIDGDIIEFGAGAGKTLALFAIALEERDYLCAHPTPFHHKIIGVDSWQGLPANDHPRWPVGKYTVCESWHPTLRCGEAITREAVRRLFRLAHLPTPILITGHFETALTPQLNSVLNRAAVVHFDCDLEQSTVAALRRIDPYLQHGSVMLFDDWHHFASDPSRGEQAAFSQWLNNHPDWRATDWGDYATFAKAFILRKH